MSLTPRQNELLVFIRAYVARNGRSPSFTEMLRAINLKSRCSISRMIDVLVREKYLARTNGDACSLKPLQTEDYHVADCDCAACVRLRYQRQLELVKALQVCPKLPGNIRLVGIKVLHRSVRLSWLRTDDGRKPRLLRTEAAKNPHHHRAAGGIT